MLKTSDLEDYSKPKSAGIWIDLHKPVNVSFTLKEQIYRFLLFFEATAEICEGVKTFPQRVVAGVFSDLIKVAPAPR